jgi:hypothetical protein
MTLRRQGALIAVIILLAALTYIAAAAGHPLFLINAYELDET